MAEAESGIEVRIVDSTEAAPHRRKDAMARRIRVEFPGAIDHILDRGDPREPIFEDDEDGRSFLETLAQACERCGCRPDPSAHAGLRLLDGCGAVHGASEPRQPLPKNATSSSALEEIYQAPWDMARGLQTENCKIPNSTPEPAAPAEMSKHAIQPGESVVVAIHASRAPVAELRSLISP